jgi:parvulin-like peptidyl-prolyl cis-trans isomerase-like protein
MGRWGWMCLLLVSVAHGQSGTTTSAPIQNPEAPKAAAAPAPANKVAEDAQFAAERVPQDAPIITIPGLCEKPPASKTSAADCKTVFTRAQFEKLVDLVQPHSSQAARRMLAYTYIQTLIKAQKAQEMGLDKLPDFDSRVEVLRLFVTAKALEDSQRKQEWDKISDKEIEDYYRNNPAEFVQVDLDRIFVPYFEPDDDPKQKLSEAEKQKRNQDWRQTLKNEAEKLRTRAMAGEDFFKLQEEANRFTDLANGPVTTWDINLRGFRRSMFTGELLKVMDVEPGQFTPVLTVDNGYYVFKMIRKTTLPFEKVRGQLHRQLANERYDRDKAAIEQVAATSAVYNDDYFGPPPKESKTAAPGATPAQNQP